MAARHPQFARMAAIADSVLSSGMAGELAGTTSMHDILVVTPRPTRQGCLMYTAASFDTFLTVTVHPNYLVSMVPSLLIGGAGVGLALPTILSSATADLPPAQSATGSAVVNMSRQVGTVLGVCILVAVLGAPATATAA